MAPAIISAYEPDMIRAAAAVATSAATMRARTGPSGTVKAELAM